MDHKLEEERVLKAVLFDFGGVLAEEGFREGLRTIARLNGLEEQGFIANANRTVHDSGYVVGKAEEETYWKLLRKSTAIRGDDQFLRDEILSRFILREWMIELVKKIRNARILVGILSDQTNWLDELNSRYGFFRWFDYVFNSYHMGTSKKSPQHFAEAVHILGVEPHNVLFIDDDPGNCERAGQAELRTILYIDRNQFLREMMRYFPAIIENH